MIVLGLDTSTADTAVGLFSDTDGLPITLAAAHRPAPGQRPGHAEQLLGLAAGVLHEASLTWGAVDRIAVGVGPGTFTGLRIGIATARGLAQAAGCALVGVSSLHGLAEAAGEPERPVLAAIDARRGELYAAAWAAGRAILPPRTVKPDDLPALVAELGGTTSAAPLAVGDGALLRRTELESAGLEVPPAGDPRHHVDGLALCRLARYAPATGRDDVLPDYIRAPDAIRTADREAAAAARA